MTGYASDPGFSLLYVLNQFSVGNGSVSQFPRSTSEISQNAFAAKGKHRLSFGLNYRRLALDDSNTTSQNPIAVYVGLNILIYGLYGIIPGATFNATADFILGAPYTFYQQDGFYSKQRGKLFGLYGEDSYKLTRKLTLTAGLRWDPFLPYTLQAGHVTCFKQGFQSTVYTNALEGLASLGDPGCPSAGVGSSLAEFQPRVGLSLVANQQAEQANKPNQTFSNIFARLKQPLSPRPL